LLSKLENSTQPMNGASHLPTIAARFSSGLGMPRHETALVAHA
jgi:hypothetical protein